MFPHDDDGPFVPGIQFFADGLINPVAMTTLLLPQEDETTVAPSPDPIRPFTAPAIVTITGDDRRDTAQIMIPDPQVGYNYQVQIWYRAGTSNQLFVEFINNINRFHGRIDGMVGNITENRGEIDNLVNTDLGPTSELADGIYRLNFDYFPPRNRSIINIGIGSFVTGQTVEILAVDIRRELNMGAEGREFSTAFIDAFL